MTQLLSVKDLKVDFKTRLGAVQAVRGVSFDLAGGEAIALVGESGCGKSVTALSIMRLIPAPPGCTASGRIIFEGQELLLKNEKEMRRIRGSGIAMIFQETSTSLNPSLKVGTQISEVLQNHSELTAAGRKQRALEAISTAGLPDPEMVYRQYPHQLSGGMQQRAMIAMALACGPRLLIADEPTTALDVTVQAQIIELLREIKQKFGTSLLLITHDLAIAAGIASRIMIMYAGKIVESGTARDIFYEPGHPYTRGLLASIPRPGRRQELSPIPGGPPDLINPPRGCAFWPRCGRAMLICRELPPPAADPAASHQVCCWLTHSYSINNY